MSIFGKKPNHYQSNKKKKDERQVMSFEQLPLDEYEEEQSSKTPLKLDKKKIIVAVSILLVLVISVLAYFGLEGGFSCQGVSSDSGFTVSISGSKVEPGNFLTFSGGLCYASDTGFTYLSSKGEEIFNTQLGFGSPVLLTSGKAALIYDLGATGFTLCSDTSVVHTAEAEDKIYLADVTSDFSYALVTENSGYNARFTVYGPDHKLKFAYNFSEYYITSVALNNDATGAVICGVSSDQGTRVSAIYVLDFTKEEPVAKHIISGDIIFDCDYLSRSSVCAVGSEGTYICNGRNFSKLTKKSYNQMSLTAYDINSDVGVIALSLSRSGDGRNCSIEYINSHADTEKTIETDLALVSVSTYKDRVAVSDTSGVYIYRSNGELLKSHDVASDCSQVRLYSTDGIYLLGLDDIFAFDL